MKKTRFGKRRSLIDRFNQPMDESNFLSIFQIAMSEKLMLEECGEFDKEKFRRFLWKKINRLDDCIDLKVKPILLSCKIGPNFYLDIQETAKRIFGEYIAMDELIIFLLDYFTRNYSEENSGKEVPLFVRKYPGKSRSNLNSFHSKFSKFYKNHVVSFRT
jgi:hypothetical protein